MVFLPLLILRHSSARFSLCLSPAPACSFSSLFPHIHIVLSRCSPPFSTISSFLQLRFPSQAANSMSCVPLALYRIELTSTLCKSGGNHRVRRFFLILRLLPLCLSHSPGCDACRARKVRCARENPDDPKQSCKHCIALGIPCTYDYQPKKRGPPNL